MHEIDIVLSDLLLASVAGVLGWRLEAGRAEPAAGALRLILLAIAAGALLGGLWHALFSLDTGVASLLLWRLTMVALGVTAYGFARLGLALLRVKRDGWQWVFLSLLIVYLLLLVSVDAFWLATAINVPATLLALLGSVKRSCMPGVAGILLLYTASFYQLWGPDPVPWLTHNAIYHLMLIPALWLLWFGVRRMRRD